jgi:beta-glucosidase
MLARSNVYAKAIFKRYVMNETAKAVEAKGFHPEYPYPFQNPKLRTKDRVEDLLSRLTPEEKVSVFCGGTAYRRFGLQGGRGTCEALHGVAWVGWATSYPASLGLSQSWDTELFYDIGEAMGKEVYAYGRVGTLAPVVDLLRDPRYGRAYETLGEDPALTGDLGTAMAKGLNKRTEGGYQMVIPTMKHFMAYNVEINRIWVSSNMTQRNLREYYFRPFQYPTEAGAAKGVMNSYHVVNGRPMMVNPFQGDHLLKRWTPTYPDSGQYEFTVVTDFHNPPNLYRHNQRFYYDDPEGRALSAADSIKNGTIGFGELPNLVSPTLRDAVARGLVTWEDIEENVRRTLTLRVQVGDLDHFDAISPYNKPEYYGSIDINLDRHKKLALKAGQEQIVLLKNDGILPLKGKDTKQMALIGLLGDQVLRDHYTANYPYSITIKDALENKLGKENVAFSRAVDTVAIKAANGQYLLAKNNSYANVSTVAGQMAMDLTIAKSHKDAITADGGTTKPTMADKDRLFQIYDYGSGFKLIRTPINDLFAQCSSEQKFINNASAPGIGRFPEKPGDLTQPLSYVNFHKFSFADLGGGKTGIYHHSTGDKGLSYGGTTDDEELNHGTFLAVVPDEGIIIPSGGAGPVDDPTRLAKLSREHGFEFEELESKTKAADDALAAISRNAPILLALGYESHINAREAIDLQRTGLSGAQLEVINHIAKDLDRDIILVVKTGNPMIITEELHNNPKIRAIIEIGQSCQEEGSALMSAIFDDGYKGVEPGFTGDIPMAAPAGRLSATWYRKITDMPGADENQRLASYREPPYDVNTNDNVSKMNGAIPTGILTYDICKGRRTYQYVDKKPLYPFGYGLTYSPFEYSGLRLDAQGPASITVTVEVKNAGAYTNDEVVQFYGAYDKTQARKPRFEQPNKRLLGFRRLHDVAPGETRSVTIMVDIRDKLAVWDVTRDIFWIEPGAYIIEAARSSADNVSAKISAQLGDAEIPHWKMCDTLIAAEKFEDYSLVGKFEILACHYDDCQHNDSTAVRIEMDQGWLKYGDVDFNGRPAVFTALVSAERDTDFSIYLGDPASGGACVKTIKVTDTRPDTSISPDLGQGPGMDRDDPVFINKPQWKKICVDINGLDGIHDLYLVTSKRGLAIAWFKFGSAQDKVESLALYPENRRDSIRVQKGSLQVKALPSPISSMDAVSFSVSVPDGSATGLAAINGEGLLIASGAGNGIVRVTARANGKTASVDILVTNQLDANKHSVDGKPVTIDYLLFNVGMGIEDHIMTRKGTLAHHIHYRTPDKWYDQTTYDSLPVSAVNWSVSALNGGPTDLAFINQEGLLTAAGKGNGFVKVKAVLKTNVDIYVERIVALENQAPKNAFALIEAEHYDSRTPYTPPPLPARFSFFGVPTDTGSTFEAGSNEMGMYVIVEDGNEFVYHDVNFGSGAKKFIIRLSCKTDLSVSLYADNKDILASVAALNTGSDITYKTYEVDIATVSGIHDLYLKYSGTARVNWFQFL